MVRESSQNGQKPTEQEQDMASKTKTKKKPAKKASNTAKPAVKKIKQAKTPEEHMAQLKERYPNHKFVKDSLQFHKQEQRYSVEIFCASGNGQKRRCFTSDLFQVKYCKEVQKQMANEKRRAKRDEAKKALRAATKTA